MNEVLNQNLLCEQNLSVSVPGKIILIGEHSVVYGHSALAMPFSNARLTLSLHAEPQKTWEDAWKIIMQGSPLELSEKFKTLLVQAFAMALSFFDRNLYQYAPQTLLIESQIPLGGGMGGSAAVSASLVKLCAKLCNRTLSLSQEIECANKIDSLFHSGRASGLDVATILTESLIHFKKDEFLKPIQNNCQFHLVLIDSMERSETSAMIKKVSMKVDNKDTSALQALEALGRLSQECEHHLRVSDLKHFAQCLNEAQSHLNLLGVSTQKINRICQDVKEQGALCAKLTGAGGGGLVLAIFEKKSEFLLKQYPSAMSISI